MPPLRISVFGLGYVGAVTAAGLAESGHEVVAYDIDLTRLACVAQGRAPVGEPGLDALLAAQVARGALRTAPTAAAAVAATDLSMICVGTPPGAGGRPDLSALTGVSAMIADGIMAKGADHAVVLRSTVLPSTARRVVLPLLQDTGRDVGLCVHPEFLREGSALSDWRSPPQIVVGAFDTKTAQTVLSLYPDSLPRAVTTPEAAEAIKYASNAWHALKVTFANELGAVLKSFGVDSHAVMDVFCRDKRLNISEAYLKPGFAFGGSCLPKDLRALCAAAEENGVAVPLLSAVSDSNDAQIARARALIARSGAARVGLMGVAFKGGTDDVRGSALVRLAELLIADGIDVAVYDPRVTTGGTHLPPAVARRLTDDADGFAERADLFVVGHDMPDFTRIAALSGKPVVDLVRAQGLDATPSSYAGIAW